MFSFVSRGRRRNIAEGWGYCGSEVLGFALTCSLPQRPLWYAMGIMRVEVKVMMKPSGVGVPGPLESSSPSPSLMTSLLWTSWWGYQVFRGGPDQFCAYVSEGCFLLAWQLWKTLA